MRLEELDLLLDAAAGERIARAVVEREQLGLARLRDREGRHELGERLGIGEAPGDLVGAPRRRLARHQQVASEGLAREEDAARKPERGIERALEGGLEALHPDAEITQQTLRDFAVLRVGGIDRLAAAVADHQAAVEQELVALGVAAEIIVVVEHEDARGRPGGAAIEPGGRQSADAGANDDEVVALLDRQAVERKAAHPRAPARARSRTSRRAGRASR